MSRHPNFGVSCNTLTIKYVSTEVTNAKAPFTRKVFAGLALAVGLALH